MNAIFSFLVSRPRGFVPAVLVTASLLAATFLAGMFAFPLVVNVVGRSADHDLSGQIDPRWSESGALAALLGERSLHASTAAVGESFAMATGAVDADVEGLFLLDFVTGDLQGVVMNFRTGKFGAVFRANVIQALGIDEAKRPKYLMTTGRINFPRGATAAQPGNCVVYVMDTTTGNFAAYGIPWRREFAATGRLQIDGLLLLDTGTARTAAIRE